MAGNGVTVFIEHVRSFAEAQEIPIRPLTLLVGENSSGKSTFLAVASALFDHHRFPLRPSFNEPPFNLGIFETIATYKAGRYGRDEHFTIGYSLGSEGQADYCMIRGTYIRDRGKAVLSRLQGTSSLGRVEIEVRDDEITGSVTIRSSKGATLMNVAVRDFPDAHKELSTSPLGGDLTTLLLYSIGRSRKERADVDVKAIWELSRSFHRPFTKTVAFAPIRTRPKRTYDELSEDYSSEGDHVPKLLARLLSEVPQSKPARRVQEAIIKFGQESGLFRDVE